MHKEQPTATQHKTHRKENSTDSIQSYRKRKFLSVVSSESLMLKQPTHLRKISELKKPGLDLTNEQTKGAVRAEEGKTVTRKIKRASAQL